MKGTQRLTVKEETLGGSLGCPREETPEMMISHVQRIEQWFDGGGEIAVVDGIEMKKKKRTRVTGACGAVQKVRDNAKLQTCVCDL